MARSYAQQAVFDLEGARQSLEEAVAADPGDALAWARLAEIQLSFGELSQAEATAKKATTLAPELSRTQTVLGFAYLTQVKIDDAMAAFDKAIQADQADPLPRLGMGLARIRKGRLAEGRAEIEVAASLDPNNSLIRSYLGKAFFEEKRIGLDEREFQIAKELDPNDPTPHFYSAIAKQTTNRPGGGPAGLRDRQAAQRQPGRLPLAAAAGLGPGRPQRGHGPHLQRPGLWPARPAGRLQRGQRRPDQLLGPPLSGRHLCHPAAPRDRPGQRAAAVPAAAAHQHHPHPAGTGGEQPVSDQLPRGRRQSSFNEFNPLFTRNRAARASQRPCTGERHLGRARASSRASTTGFP